MSMLFCLLPARLYGYYRQEMGLGSPSTPISFQSGCPEQSKQSQRENRAPHA